MDERDGLDETDPAAPAGTAAPRDDPVMADAAPAERDTVEPPWADVPEDRPLDPWAWAEPTWTEGVATAAAREDVPLLPPTAVPAADAPDPSAAPSADLLEAGADPAPPAEDGADPASAPSPDSWRRAGSDGATRHATVICVANQKGGVGKTTTAVSLASGLALAGAQVLLVDLDPQANATTGLGLRAVEGGPSTYRVLVDGVDVEDATEPTAVRGLHCIPASLDLAGAEIELVPAFSRELCLRKALDVVRDLYDVILIDCPPSLGLLTINALAAADVVLTPIQCEYYALEGVGQLQRSLELVRSNLNPGLRLGGIVLTMFDGRTRLSQQVVDEVRRHFGDTVFRTVIPRTVRLSEAPGFGQPITVLDPSSRGARAYMRLVDEVALRLELPLRHMSTVEGPRPTSTPAPASADAPLRKDLA